jgi:epoxide hydrolase 4
VTGRDEHDVVADGVRIHYVTSGDGPLVVLLHGFPETHRSFELQIPFLAEHGFRVVAPDLPGYGASGPSPRGYDLDTLSRVIAAFLTTLGERPRAVVGHDWGAVMAWHLAARHPDALERAVVLDCPPSRVLARALATSAQQRRRSWYIFFFQLPLLPERWLVQNDGRNLGRMFRNADGLDRRPREVAAADRQILTRQGALSGPLAYYRTAFRRPGRRRARELGSRVPVSLIWGEDDRCVGVELVEHCRPFAESLDVNVVAGAGHFVHQEQPDAVNRLLLAALA